MNTKPPTAAQLAARKALEDALRPHADAIGPIGLVEVIAYTLGQLVALQDQTAHTPGDVMQRIAKNIELGNADAIEKLLGQPAGRA